VQQGYGAALTMIKYKVPSLSNAKIVEWYKEGFDSNKEVNKIKEDALTLGQSGEQLKVPRKYQNAEVIYKHFYEVGYKEYEEKQSDTRKAAIGGGIGVLALGLLGRRLYVARKMKG
jgi:hypothetical protein